jgi:hypothetical protein
VLALSLFSQIAKQLQPVGDKHIRTKWLFYHSFPELFSASLVDIQAMVWWLRPLFFDSQNKQVSPLTYFLSNPHSGFLAKKPAFPLSCVV